MTRRAYLWLWFTALGLATVMLPAQYVDDHGRVTSPVFFGPSLGVIFSSNTQICFPIFAFEVIALIATGYLLCRRPWICVYFTALALFILSVPVLFTSFGPMLYVLAIGIFAFYVTGYFLLRRRNKDNVRR